MSRQTKRESRSRFTGQREPCSAPDCNSSDGVARYDDGHTFCFVCSSYTHGNGEVYRAEQPKDKLIDIDSGDHRPMDGRGLSLGTVQFFNYTMRKVKGVYKQFAPYYLKDGSLAGFHIKYMKNGKKCFSWAKGAEVDSLNEIAPWGWQRWRHRSDKMCVITEGEIDAMSISQIQDHEWPVFSIPTGAGPQARQWMAHWREELVKRYDKIILMFDMDEVGRATATSCAQVLGPKARIAELPMHDVNDMLMANKGGDVIRAMWGATPYRPEEIVTLAKLRDRVMEGPKEGLSYPWEFLTQWTYGIRLGEIIAIGAGTGSGKTDLMTQIAMHLLTEHNKQVAMFMLEQEPQETATRMTGKYAGKRFHIPVDPDNPQPGDWTQEQLVTSYDNLMKEGGLFLYDSFGINEWETIQENMRFLREAEGVEYFFLDHLTALADWQDSPTQALGTIMAEMGGLVKELGITIFMVSHLNTPEGKPHEEGGRVTIRNFRGSRAIGYWCHYAWGLERNQQAAEGESKLTTFRTLKDRYTGNSLGNTAFLGYNSETGDLYTAAGESGFGFDDETEEDEDTPKF